MNEGIRNEGPINEGMINEGPRIAIPIPRGMVRVKYANYFNALRRRGAQPETVGLDVDPARFDGLLLPGGGDMCPSCYHQECVHCADMSPMLDDMQLGALEAFVRVEKPVLGICRGHQLVNVYFGGTLVQHLPQAAAHVKRTPEEDSAHVTRTEPGSVVRALYGEAPWVNSAHHQGVDELGRGLRVTQWSGDGVVEAMEHERLPILCVQGHPERVWPGHPEGASVDGGKLIERFLEMCGG